MKNILLLFLLLPVMCLAQIAENAALQVSDLTYSNGQYHFQLAIKQPCSTEVAINWNSKNSDSIITLPAKSSLTIDIKAPYMAGSYMKVKAIKTCIAGGNSGWLSVPVPPLMVLPIHLISFTATKVLDQVKLRFILTFSGGFPFAVVEHSTDGKKWAPLYVITSDMEHEYIDPLPNSGANYYRLRMVDTDDVSYSKVLLISFSKAISGPLTVLDVNGHYLREINVMNTADIQKAIAPLPKGIYFLTDNTTTYKVANY